jgi:hypothetical protein
MNPSNMNKRLAMFFARMEKVVERLRELDAPSEAAHISVPGSSSAADGTFRTSFRQSLPVGRRRRPFVAAVSLERPMPTIDV